MIFFTEKTFYEDRKSPFLVILIINIVLLVISTITSGIIQFLASSDIIIIGITRICIASQIMTIGGWQFMAAFNALKEFKSNEIVEPWVKVRYYLIIIYSACDFGGGATFIFLPLDKSVDIVFILASIFILILIAAQFLAWIMPRPLKKWLNRNYKTPEDGKELSEEQIISGFGE
ncbi:MAG: hypothetical protein EAX96_13565 [Candidatus Lokiarchaeota archaeon]|nr:hypothetical protein [Candidatus Lokiarchaeota archaeon]